VSSHKTVLVTGAYGFIGSHLAETLVRNGYNVREFTSYNSFNSWGWLDNCAEDVGNIGKQCRMFNHFVANGDDLR
jgi:dTDP-glucose 4,6-dehydratase